VARRGNRRFIYEELDFFPKEKPPPEAGVANENADPGLPNSGFDDGFGVPNKPVDDVDDAAPADVDAALPKAADRPNEKGLAVADRPLLVPAPPMPLPIPPPPADADVDAAAALGRSVDASAGAAASPPAGLGLPA
jgi:hypothetical protein